jgi:hypothetical protein
MPSLTRPLPGHASLVAQSAWCAASVPDDRAKLLLVRHPALAAKLRKAVRRSHRAGIVIYLRGCVILEVQDALAVFTAIAAAAQCCCDFARDVGRFEAELDKLLCDIKQKAKR